MREKRRKYSPEFKSEAAPGPIVYGVPLRPACPTAAYRVLTTVSTTTARGSSWRTALVFLLTGMTLHAGSCVGAPGDIGVAPTTRHLGSSTPDRGGRTPPSESVTTWNDVVGLTVAA
jgi:hypothetical protein